jgi:hypothetical protein
MSKIKIHHIFAFKNEKQKTRHKIYSNKFIIY